MTGEAYVGRKFATEFLGKAFQLEDAVSDEFIRISRQLDSLNMGPEHAGNISVRAGKGMLIKAGGASFRGLRKEDIIMVVDYDRSRNRAEAYGLRDPSSETPMHWLVYENYPRVNAVIHAHDPVVLANQLLVGKLGVAETKKTALYGTLDQADQVVEALKKTDYVFIRGHGSVSVGENLQAAYDAILRVHRRFLA